MGLRRSMMNLTGWIYSRSGATRAANVNAAVDAAHGWPMCDLCGKPIDKATIVEGGIPGLEVGSQYGPEPDLRLVEPSDKTWVKVLVEHHGAEEVATFDFGSVQWGPSDLHSYMRKKRWFEPEHAEDGSLTVGTG